jgi:predicted lipoprotein with Yx(FWY)xxD motif
MILVLVTGCRADRSPVDAGAPGASPDPLPVRVSGLFAIDSRTLGAIVIDGEGYVLYRYDRDSPDPSRSACLDGCAVGWLPVPASADLRVVGIDRALVGAVTRPDGSRQLTLADWPLYEYAGDRLPGDANGQGIDGAWWVVTPGGGRGGGGPRRGG